jgi:hypothetical protein
MLPGLERRSHRAARMRAAVDSPEVGPGTYVPTPIAEAGGGYSAVVQSNEVGSEGGQVLTDETVKAIKALWE